MSKLKKTFLYGLEVVPCIKKASLNSNLGQSNWVIFVYLNVGRVSSTQICAWEKFQFLKTLYLSCFNFQRIRKLHIYNLTYIMNSIRSTYKLMYYSTYHYFSYHVRWYLLEKLLYNADILSKFSLLHLRFYQFLFKAI